MTRRTWIAIVTAFVAASGGALFAGGAAEREPQTPPPIAAANPETFSGLEVPRFASLRYDEVNGRQGPSFEHPVLWRYQRRGLPVEVVRESPHWWKVRDPDGELVWIHARMFDSRRTVMADALDGDPLAIRRRPSDDAPILAYAEAGVVFTLGACEDGWCRIIGAQASGWTPAASLWGVYPDEAR